MNLINHPVMGLMVPCTDTCRSCTQRVPDWYSIDIARKALGNRNDIVGIDLGAHVGMYGIALHRHVDTMYSFEINDLSFDFLTLNSNFYPQIKPIHLGSWDSDTRLKMYFNNNNNMRGSVIRLDEQTKDDISDFEYKEIDVVSLDSYFDSAINFEFLKIDVEGAEVRTLKGMKNLIEKNKDIFMILEFSKQHLDIYGETPEEIFRLINDFDFKYITKSQKEYEELPYDYVLNMHLGRGKYADLRF